ncbi:zinc finger HIT domain-containing protein 2 [Prorops nasuta]|uniref:zinc finger HIT domain-containing protein 2 n=1 Tax=Prorops nasuta TaxID=863751 RepID=UPI0034CD32F1
MSLEARSSSNSKGTSVCEICDVRPRIYTCPRCGIGYCNLECYKSELHFNCSESFYKQWVEEELKSQENDPESRKKMVEILKRLHQKDEEGQLLFDDSDEADEENNDLNNSQLDSDDELPVPDLATRMESINLDNADEVWSALTDAEKQEFEALLKNGEAEKLLPLWNPWWTIKIDKKKIQEIDIEEDITNSEKYPPLISVPHFNELQKASSNIYFNLLNVIYAYAYVALYYNGDYMNCSREAAHTFFNICENMKNNRVLKSREEAKESVLQCIKACNWITQDRKLLFAMEEAATTIIHGPRDTDKFLFIQIALSELHRLLSIAKTESSRNNLSKDKKFSKRFLQNVENQEVSKKSLFLCTKKIEFYLSWALK